MSRNQPSEWILFPTGREEGDGALKREDMIKGQKADICRVCLGNNESNMAEGGCQGEYLCLPNEAGRNSNLLTLDASGD